MYQLEEEEDWMHKNKLKPLPQSLTEMQEDNKHH